jgi:hypothetical protein
VEVVTIEHQRYQLHAEGVSAADLSLVVLRDLCDLLIEGSTRAIRLAVEGRSVARGAQPPWLAAASDLRVVEYREGSLQMGVVAPTLLSAAPETFSQQQLFWTLRPANDTALDVFLDAVRDAAAGTKDSERLDAGILDVITRAEGLFARGSTRLTISGGKGQCVTIDPDTLRCVRDLSEQTPSPRVARVSGVLDVLTYSARAFVLRVGSDEKVSLRGIASAGAFDELMPLLGKHVVVEGQVAYRPSGNPSRIEIDKAWLAGEGDVVWERLPVQVSAALRPAASTPELASLYGKWPGEEKDEDLFTALEQLS